MHSFELVEFYYHQKLNGVDYSKIRLELKEKSLSVEGINEIMKEVDTRIMSELNQETSRELNINFQRNDYFLLVIEITFVLLLTIGLFGSYGSILPLSAIFCLFSLSSVLKRTNVKSKKRNNNFKSRRL